MQRFHQVHGQRVLSIVVALLALIAQPLPVLAFGQPSDRRQTLWATQWNHDGSKFAVGGDDTLWIYDADSLQRRSIMPPTPEPARADGGYAPTVTQVAWHPSRNVLAISSQDTNVCGIFDIDSGSRIQLLPSNDNAGRGVTWSPTADKLAISSPGDGHLRIYERDGTLLHDIPRYKDAKGLTGVAWSPTGDRIVTIGSRITLHASDGIPIRQFMHRPEARERDQLLLSVAWHPSGDSFVVGDYGTEVDDPVVQIWSSDGALIRSINLDGDTEVRNISWNPEGTRFATSSRSLAIWTASGDLQANTVAPDLLWGVSWHPADNTILTTDIIGRITLWNDKAEPLNQIRRLEPADG
ncbi:MAG: hypothetical protein AAGI53_00005 [Planctomycetota bacterium]